MAHVFDKLELREACETLKSDPSVRIDRVKQTTRVGLYELAVEGENGVVCTLRLLSGILEFQRIWPQFVKQVEEEVKDESKTFVCNNPRLASPAALAVNVMEIHSATSSSVYTVYRPAACEYK